MLSGVRGKRVPEHGRGMRMRMERDNAHLLIIDIQEKLVPAVVEAEPLIAAASRLIAIARRLDVAITVSEQYPRGLGPTVAPVREALGNAAAVLDKVHFSCMRDEKLRQRMHTLRAGGRNQVVIAGMETHVCVMQTALGLLADGYEVFIAADAVSSRSARDIEFALRRMEAAGAALVTGEMVTFEWLDKAGTPEFKELQQLIK
jgi:isochorismate hydrolase